MKRVILSLISLLLLLVIAALVIPFFIPADMYKQQVLSLIQEKTDRAVNVEGDISFHLFPNPSLDLEKVTIGNPSGFERAAMAEIESLSLEVALMPLLDREVHVLGLRLKQPVIHLEKTSSGANWEFKERLATGEEGRRRDESPAPGRQSFRMETLEITNGEITYTDHTGNASYTLRDVKALLRSGDKTKLNLTGRYRNAPVSLSAITGSIQKLLDGGEELLSVDFDGPGVDAQFEGAFSTIPLFKGNLSVSVDSVNKLQEALNNEPAVPGNIQDGFALQGQAAWKDQHLSLRDMEIKFAGLMAQGNVDADLSGSKPSASASLHTKSVDLAPFTGGEAPLAPQEGGGAGPKTWSTKQIDFSGLKSFNLALDLHAEEVKHERMAVQNVQGKVHIQEGVLRAEFPALALFEGTGSLLVKVDANNTPVIEEQVKLKGVNAEQLLQAAAEFDKLSGRLDAELSTTARGNSQQEWVKNLDGSGSFTFTNGTIKGVNLASMVRNVKSAFLAGKTLEQTDFAELSGTLKAADGIVRNDDLVLKAPLLRLTGAGEANLPARTINYRLEPKLVKSLEGQGAVEAEEAKGLVVPVLVSGTFDDPKFAPDLKSAVEEGLKNPENVKQTIKDLKGGVKEEIKGIEREIKGIRDLFKKPKAESATGPAAQPPPAAAPEASPAPAAGAPDASTAPALAPARSSEPASTSQ